MGTRADFYVGRGVDAEWLGSIAWDGYPPGIPAQILNCTSPEAFRHSVAQFIAERRDGTKPEQGWPWPWDDSCTTDFAYAIDDGLVYASCFGGEWLTAAKYDEEAEALDKSGGSSRKGAVFPNMAHVKEMTLGERSGVIVLGRAR